MNPRVLIVDDDEAQARLTQLMLREAGFDCRFHTAAAAALQALDEYAPDLVLADLKMPQMDGIELLRRVREQRPEVPVVLLTGFGSVTSAVTAMREGAFDYVTKPLEPEALRRTVLAALKTAGDKRAEDQLRPDELFIAQSPRSKEVVELARRVARSRSTVIIQGRSGTGKELIARLLHFWSERADGPFVAVNCKAFAEGVLESELFGHEKGAFTGASDQHLGCFERAGGGTLFLDEIGEISLDFQAKLLRVLQDGEVLRVGGSVPHKVDVRLVAATNRMLREDVAQGRFRQDLFFRLNVIPINLPALHERREDIMPIARRLLARVSAESRRRLRFSPTAEAALLAYEWPGNIRELENVVERAVVLADSGEIDVSDLQLEQESAPAETNLLNLHGWLAHATVARINAALALSRGNRMEAARTLGVHVTTLYRLMHRFGIERDDTAAKEAGHSVEEADVAG